jgi:hypothetical protein
MEQFANDTVDVTASCTTVAVVSESEVIATEVLMSETEAREHIEAIKLCFDDIASLLLDLDDRRGWEALHYRSMHQLIQAELKDHLNKSVSQIYRLLNEAKIRRELSQICEKVEEVPAYKLEPLGKLPPHCWGDTWEEVISTATNGEVTRQHVQTIVEQRLRKHNFKPVSLRPGDWVEVHSLQQECCWDGLRGCIVEPEDDSGQVGVDLSQASGQSDWQCVRFRAQELIKLPVPSPHKVGEIAMVRCGVGATPEQRKYSGCWGSVQHVFESTVIVAVGSELVEYCFEDLDYIDSPSLYLIEVCDRVTRLWSLPNLPKSVRHLLRTFYQRELVFLQEDLYVLQAIERLCHPDLTELVDTEEDELLVLVCQPKIEG